MPIGNTFVYNAGDLILHTVSSSGNTFQEVKLAAATSSLVLFNSNGTLTSQSLNTTTIGTSSVSLFTSGSTSIITNLTASNISASVVTASLFFGTSSWAQSASNALYSDISLYSVSSSTSQDITLYVKNTSGAIIPKGKIVRIKDVENSSFNPTIELADYRYESSSANTVGYTNETFAINAFGYVITEGKLTGVDTSTFTAGDLLYLSSSGQVTNVKPIPPDHGVRVGQVIRSNNSNGSIYVTIDNGAELDELHNVIDTSNTSNYGDLLVKSGSVWKNTNSLTGSYIITGSLNITQNISASSLTGSLLGTSSWAQSASNAFFANTASYVNISSLNAFVQGGNSFGSEAVLGTNDANGLTIETSGSRRAYVTVAGKIIVGNSTSADSDLNLVDSKILSLGSVGGYHNVYLQRPLVVGSSYQRLHFGTRWYFDTIANVWTSSTQPNVDNPDWTAIDSQATYLSFKVGSITGSVTSLTTSSYNDNERLRLTTAGAILSTSGSDTEFRIVTNDSTNDPKLTFYSSSTALWAVGVDDSDDDKFKINQGSLLNTSNVITVNTSSNVGIGAINPIAKLHISASGVQAVRIETDDSADTNSQLYIEGNKSNGAPALSTAVELKSNIDYRGRGIIYSISGSNQPKWYSGVPYTGNGFSIGYDSTGAFPWYVASSSLFITPSRNVGIGTTNPVYKLDVSGSSARVNTSDGSGLILGSTKPISLFNYTSYGSNGSQLWAINQSGVGDVISLALGANFSYAKSVELSYSTSSGEFAIGSQGSSAGTHKSINLVVNNTSSVFITGSTSGYSSVGIGTTTPNSFVNTTSTYFSPNPASSFLTLYSKNSEASINLISSGSTNGASIGGIYFTRQQGQSDAHRHIAAIKAVQNGTSATLAGGKLFFYTKVSGGGTFEVNPQLTIVSSNNSDYSDANVGIGTSSPAYTLHVRNLSKSGSLGIDVDAALGGSNRDGVFTVSPDVVSNTGGFLFKTYNGASVNALSITPTGSVGIGTTNPTTTLHVVGTISASNIDAATQFLGNTGDNASTPSFSFTNDTNTGMFNPLNGDSIAFSANGIERFRITTSSLSSSVGIIAASFTGSLVGTSSWAQTSSVALTASYVNVSGLNAYVQGGNSFGASATLGTNDANSLALKTSGSTRMTIGAGGQIAVNASPGPGVRFYVNEVQNSALGSASVYINTKQNSIDVGNNINTQGISNEYVLTGNPSGSTQIQAQFNNLYISSSGNITGSYRGLRNNITINAPVTMSATSGLINLYLLNQFNLPATFSVVNIPDYRIINTSLSTVGATPTGSISSFYDIVAGGMDNTFGTSLSIDNSIGVYIQNRRLSSATITNSWGLYQLGANDNNYFAGKVGIGITNPVNKLDVAGNISASIITASRAYFADIGFNDQTIALDTSTFPTGSVNVGFNVDSGIYTSGLYRTRFLKIDRAGNIPLYIQETTTNSGSFTNLVRFGTHNNSTNTFEVFGSSNIQGSLTSSNFVGPHIGNTTGTASWATNATVALSSNTASWSTNATTAHALNTGLSYTVNNLTASNITASTVTSSNVLVNGNLTVTGSIFASIFSASNVYITSSQFVVTDNIITLNALTPYQRYAGLQMFDSGSGTISNLLWDGQGDYFFISGSGVNGKIISGPDAQADLTTNYVPKATAGYILGNSTIQDNGSGVGVLTAPNSIAGLTVNGNILFNTNYLIWGSSSATNMDYIGANDGTHGITNNNAGFWVFNHDATLSTNSGSTSTLDFGSLSANNATDNNYIAGNLLIGVTSSNANVDISYGDYQSGGALKIGANIGTNKTRTNNTRKIGMITGVSYSNPTGSPVLTLIDSDSTQTIINVGGGASGKFGATEIRFFTTNSVSAVNTTAKVVIDSAGDMGIGVLSPVNRLDVAGNISCSVITASNFFGTSSWASNSLTASYLTPTNSYIITNLTASNISASGTIRAVSLIETSTIASKYNIIPLENQLDKLLKLNPVSFNYKQTDEPSIGLIAEEVGEIYPEFTSPNKDAVAYSKMVSVLIQSVKELKSIVDVQQKQINELLKK